MGELFERYDAAPVKGKDIMIGNLFPEIFISEDDKVFCYLGICLENQELHKRSCFMHPYYMQGKHSTDKRVAKEIKDFYRLAEGCIVLDKYVDADSRNDRIYKRIDADIRFPALDTYYAVMVDRREDDELTRAVFGLTYDEINILLKAYAKTIGTYNEYISYPKLTRSGRSANSCDMTDVWIPESFPYVAFEESRFLFSHVSLWGFYRHVQLLARCKLTSTASQILLKAGANEPVLKRLFEIGRTIYYQTKVMREF